MSNRSRIAIAFAAGVLAAGCTSPHRLIVNTYPQGALLTEHQTGKQYLAPATINYYPEPKHRDPETGCVRVHGFDARWASGAQAGTEPMLRVFCGGITTEWEIYIDRPAGAPGKDVDIRAAQTRLQQIEVARTSRSDVGANLMLNFLTGVVEGQNQSRTRQYYPSPLELDALTTRRRPADDTLRCIPSPMPTPSGQTEYRCRN